MLDDDAWSAATVIEDFHQVNPVEFAEPSERMQVYVVYDRDTLYIGARLFDATPIRLRRHLGREGFVVLNHNLEDPDRDNSFRSRVSEMAVKFGYTFRF